MRRLPHRAARHHRQRLIRVVMDVCLFLVMLKTAFVGGSAVSEIGNRPGFLLGVLL